MRVCKSIITGARRAPFFYESRNMRAGIMGKLGGGGVLTVALSTSGVPNSVFITPVRRARLTEALCLGMQTKELDRDLKELVRFQELLWLVSGKILGTAQLKLARYPEVVRGEISGIISERDERAAISSAVTPPSS